MSDKQQRKQDKALSKVVQHAVRISEKPFLKVTKVARKAAKRAAKDGFGTDRAALEAQIRAFLQSGRKVRGCRVHGGKVYLLSSAEPEAADAVLVGQQSGNKRARQDDSAEFVATSQKAAQDKTVSTKANKKKVKATGKKAKGGKDQSMEAVRTNGTAPVEPQSVISNGYPKSDTTASQQPVAKKQKKGKVAKSVVSPKGGPGGQPREDEGEVIDGSKKPEYTWRESRKRKDLKHGRFSQAEEAALRTAAEEYAREHGMSDTDFSWMYKKGKGRQKDAVAKAWPTITQRALPDRSVRAVYNCGLRLLPSFKKGAWTEEENQRLLEMVETMGKKWRDIADELNRQPIQVRDRYRELATVSEKHKTGHWSAEECALLEEVVNEYLKNKQDVENQQTANLTLDDVADTPNGQPTPEVDSRQRVILDDVDWSWVAGKMGTRSRRQCMDKWYRALSPSMVSTGDWGVGDDRRLLKGILIAEAAFYFQVPWEDVVAGRTAKQAKRRWALMIKRVPDYQELGFNEQVTYLVDTFLPGLKEKLASSKQ